MFNTHRTAMKANAILSPKKHIFLLSHMRAYTSLLGHIMGSHPEICGYYEMHIGYHSWKSLFRQKLLYFKGEDPKPGFSFMFDKLLHNDHNLSLDVLNNRRIKTVFCLRHPQDTIPSILKLYQGIKPSHEFTSESFATDYYIQRLAMLEGIAHAMEQDFFYLDADSIKYDSDHCLNSLSDWLQLDSGLSPSYKIQKNTNRERYGDTSGRLKTGRITYDQAEYANFQHEKELLEYAVRSYERVRKLLIAKSARHCVSNSMPSAQTQKT